MPFWEENRGHTVMVQVIVLKSVMLSDLFHCFQLCRVQNEVIH